MKVPWSTSPWRRVLVYGLGISGRAAVRFLRHRSVAVLAVDDGEPERQGLAEWSGDEGVEVAPASGLRSLPDDIDGVVLSPGVPPDRPLVAAARERGLPVIGEIELAFPFIDGQIVAITGSNGKSTTTALTGSMLAAAGRKTVVCGNFGRPLVDCVGSESEVFVTELSSFQLESTETFRPRAAALLNLSPDHLERHGDLAGYAAAKAAIFDNQAGDDVAVFNADDPGVVEIAERSPSPRRRFFSHRSIVEDGCYLEDGVVVEVAPGARKQPLFAAHDVPVPGTHNLENAMAGALLARAVGVEARQLTSGLTSFKGLPHRVERVLEQDGVIWYDDSKGTNLGATAKSLEGFADGTVHLILGGRSKGSDAGALRDMVERKVRRLYLIGEAAGEFERALADLAPTERLGELDRAVDAASSQARMGEVVLLSPACSSFDQYDNFMRRGEHFQKLVRALAGVANG
jgi:UDP-N-acetylmuramoylalanine--D-glutamate ligase